jgi:PII-like signaling protein
MSGPAGRALRLTVFVGEDDTWHHRPLYSEIVHRAHQAGLAGASVFRGIEGFGTSSLIHTSRLLSLSEDLPVAVVIVDAEQRVRDFLPRLAELVGDGLVTLDEVEVVRFTPAQGRARAQADARTETDAAGDADTDADGAVGP